MIDYLKSIVSQNLRNVGLYITHNRPTDRCYVKDEATTPTQRYKSVVEYTTGPRSFWDLVKRSIKRRDRSLSLRPSFEEKGFYGSHAAFYLVIGQQQRPCYHIDQRDAINRIKIIINYIFLDLYDTTYVT